MAADVQPLVLGYLRLPDTDAPEPAAMFIEAMRTYAEQEGMTLADCYIDRLDPADGFPDRSAFCALMDALRRLDASAVIIPAPEHLSRHARTFAARRTIIETEAGAQLLILPSGHRP